MSKEERDSLIIKAAEDKLKYKIKKWAIENNTGNISRDKLLYFVSML